MRVIMIPKRIQAIIDSLKEAHREILEVIESSRPERERETAQHKATQLCRKLIRSAQHEASIKNSTYGIIRLRTNNLELFCFDTKNISYMAVIKEGVMVAAFTHRQKTKQTRAHSYDYHFGPAFKTKDLHAFIHHSSPKSLIVPDQDTLHPLAEKPYGLVKRVGQVIYPRIFRNADIKTSDVLAAYPQFKRERLENDLGL